MVIHILERKKLRFTTINSKRDFSLGQPCCPTVPTAQSPQLCKCRRDQIDEYPVSTDGLQIPTIFLMVPSYKLEVGMWFKRSTLLLKEEMQSLGGEETFLRRLKGPFASCMHRHTHFSPGY